MLEDESDALGTLPDSLIDFISKLVPTDLSKDAANPIKSSEYEALKSDHERSMSDMQKNFALLQEQAAKAEERQEC